MCWYRWVILNRCAHSASGQAADGPGFVPIRVSQSKQFAERLLRGYGSDRRMSVVPDISCNNMSCAAGSSRSHLHRILEIRHRKSSSVPDSFSTGPRHTDHSGEVNDEVTSPDSALSRPNDVVEIGYGVPRNKDCPATLFDLIEKGRGRYRERAPIKCYVNEYVSVQQHLARILHVSRQTHHKRPLERPFYGLCRTYRKGEERVRDNGLIKGTVFPGQESSNGYPFARTNLAHEKSGLTKGTFA